MESHEQYWKNYMYYEKMIQWATHSELKIEQLHGI